MIDRNLYCETFTRLCASEEAKKEAFQMIEKKRNRQKMPKLLRTAAIAAAMTCALAVSAGAVNMATGGAFLRSLREVWSDGYETRYEAVDEAGNVMEVSATAGASVTEENGRMILHAVKEDIDITDEMAENGAYHREWVMEQRTVAVDVTGTQEEWKLVEEVTDQAGNIYRSTVTSDDMMTDVYIGDVKVGTAVIREDPDETGEESRSTVAVMESGETDFAVSAFPKAAG